MRAGQKRSPLRQIAGRSRARLAALSDGIFAVAMTLLVLHQLMDYAIDEMQEAGTLPS